MKIWRMRFVAHGVSILTVLGLSTAWLTGAVGGVGGNILGVEPIETPLPVFDGTVVRPPRMADDLPPVEIWLSRDRYWQPDGHLDVLVRLHDPSTDLATTRLTGRILDADDNVLSTFALDPPPAGQVAFYPRLPEAFEGAGTVALDWISAVGDPIGEASAAFRVIVPEEPAATSGRIALRIDNAAGVTVRALPQTVGVPFPRGVLRETDSLRLVDEAGGEIPVQVMETARWSKFGSIRWVLCDFTVDLDGEPRELFLEYGRRASGVGRRESMSVDATHTAVPAIDAGRLRLDATGLWADVAGDGMFIQVLDAGALDGAFVEHEDGRVFRPDPATPFVIEESGPEKLVLRRQGWYVSLGSSQFAVGSGEFAVARGESAVGPIARSESVAAAHRAGLQEVATAEPPNPQTPTPTHPHTSAFPTPDSRSHFCRYETTYVIHRDSSIVRVFHTWIFTGDGNRDRIRNMGWRFPMAVGIVPAGMLAAFDEPAWLEADSLVQYDFDSFLLHQGEVRIDIPGGRAPGVARLNVPLGDRPPQQGVRLYFGVKDFWQAYPSEMEFADNAFWFHNWPRHGLPHPEPRVEVETAQLLKFAHTGEVLDFRLPDAFAEDPLDRSHHNNLPGEGAWAKGEPESVNAQGIARTEEFWLYLTSEAADEANTRRLLEGLNAESLRAVVDPCWMAASGVFHEISARDIDRFPAQEAQFENAALHTGERGWRQDLFGMWLFGERKWNQTPHSRLYRGLLKAHRGFPFSWVPYARSGDPRLLRFAQIDSRRAADANFCNHVCPAVTLTGRGRQGNDRAIGPWGVTALPWGSSTSPWQSAVTGLQAKRAHLWHAWYLTGYHRARDMAAVMDGLIRAWPGNHSAPGGRRGNEVQLKNALYSWKDGGDPWFLVRAHLIARQQREAWATDRMQAYGSFWTMGDADYHRYTGNEAHGHYVLEHIRERAGTRVGPLAYGWRISGDDTLLRIIAGALDGAAMGSAARQGSDYLQHYPLGIGALGAVANPPPGIYPAFWQRLHDYTERDDGLYVFRTPTVRFRKAAGESLPLFLGLIRLQTYQVEDDDRTWWIDGPDGREFMTGDMSGIGTFDNRPGREVVIPAEAPAGIYRLRFEFRSPHDNSMRGDRQLRGIRFPLTPPGTPEVIELDTPRMGPTSFGTISRQPRYFFHVPQTVERFAVRYITTVDGPVALIDPAGRTVWEAESPTRVDVEIDVPVADRGGLWSIIGAQFEMDPQIPPYYSIDPDRWFDPGQLTGLPMP